MEIAFGVAPLPRACRGASRETWRTWAGSRNQKSKMAALAFHAVANSGWNMREGWVLTPLNPAVFGPTPFYHGMCSYHCFLSSFWVLRSSGQAEPRAATPGTATLENGPHSPLPWPILYSLTKPILLVGLMTRSFIQLLCVRRGGRHKGLAKDQTLNSPPSWIPTTTPRMEHSWEWLDPG